jgi:hypothetical protein
MRAALEHGRAVELRATAGDNAYGLPQVWPSMQKKRLRAIVCSGAGWSETVGPAGGNVNARSAVVHQIGDQPAHGCRLGEPEMAIAEPEQNGRVLRAGRR